MLAMGKVVLSYSKDHYDPNIAKSPLGGSGHIAKEFYNQLTNAFPMDDIVYLDYRDREQISGLKDVKLLLGISENLKQISEKITPDRTILIAVNKPWIQRRKIYKKAEVENYPIRWLSSQDGIRSNSYELNGVDEIISLGNFANFQEYSQLIGNSSRVFPVNFNRLKLSSNSVQKTRTILVFCGEISFRKGIDIIEQLLPFLVEQNLKLKIVGNALNLNLKVHLDELSKKYPNNFEHEKNWITFLSPEWDQLRKEVSFAIFPSREEGQASVLAELISEGIPVIYTNDSGLDWSLDLKQPNNTDYKSWESAILKFSKLNTSELNSILKQQQRILELLGHESLQIKRLVQRIANGKFWPDYTYGPRNITAELNTDSYVIYKNHEFSNPVEVNISTPLSYKSDDIARDLIAVVDKYQNISQFHVKIGAEHFGIERCVESFVEVDSSSRIKLLSVSSSSLFASRLHTTFLRSLGPWIYDRKFTRIYFGVFIIREFYRKLVSRRSNRPN